MAKLRTKCKAMKRMHFLPTLSWWLVAATHCFSLLVGATEYEPFPDCTNDSTACKDNAYYPYCVQCHSGLALCSASSKGCGCAIPNDWIRHDNTGSYLDHQEVYKTRQHCISSMWSSQRASGIPDTRARNICQCNNTQLILLREATSPCPEPNTTCVDLPLIPGKKGGPICVAGSRSGMSAARMNFGQTTAGVLSASISIVLLLVI